MLLVLKQAAYYAACLNKSPLLVYITRFPSICEFLPKNAIYFISREGAKEYRFFDSMFFEERMKFFLQNNNFHELFLKIIIALVMAQNSRTPSAP
jgi:hypothetical protein